MLSCLRTELQRQFTLSLEKGTIRRMNVWHRLAEQFCQPTGFAGRFVGFLFRMNREGVDWTISLLEIQPTDHVLEIGFGSGHGIASAAKLASQGWVAGVDFSATMLRQATRRIAGAIGACRIELKVGDANTLPYSDNRFNKVFATNVVFLERSGGYAEGNPACDRAWWATRIVHRVQSRHGQVQSDPNGCLSPLYGRRAGHLADAGRIPATTSAQPR